MDATRDHINPRVDGGGRWVPCCATCNNLKGSLRPAAWLAFIDANPGYWRTFATHQHVASWLIDLNRHRRLQGWRSIPLYTEYPQAFMATINRL